MAQAMLNVRIDSEDKSRFEKFCKETGLNISTCINMFVKAVLREQKLPFEVKAEPVCGEESMSNNSGKDSDRVSSMNN
ncbi:MAG: type II toxin-antitoxin system RelB/DinJ family antitoxin [Selenomonadaceae bacterium]|nr:type II toxin-antitoxin system RelB/DinJ family antitoxin [Selenomonadaceae bacterium]